MTTARGHMWLGPRGYETWVPSCVVSPDFSRANYSASTGYLNGGAGVMSSKGSAKHYTMTWGARPRNEMRAITDFASGVFDTHHGVNLIYFNDPMTYDTNMAPEHLGNPAVAAEGGPGLFGWDSVPTTSATGSNQYGYPARVANYRADRASTKTYFPIPPGFTAWIGAHGSATGAAGIRVTPAIGTQDGTPAMLTLLGTTTATLVNYSIPAGNGVSGFTLDSPETGLLRNLAPNPSFESDVVGVGNTAGTGGTVTPATRVAATGTISGSWAARTTWAAATTAVSGGMHEAIPVASGTVYSFTLLTRSSIAQTLQPFVSWHDAGGNLLSTTTAANVTTTAGAAWGSAATATVANAQAPTNAASAHFGVRAVTGGANWSAASWLEIDRVQSNIGTTAQTYKDGSSSGWQWTGQVNNSISRQTADIISLAGIVIQMLPTGQSPVPGRYITGQGNAGCQFEKRPTETPYNAKLMDGQGGVGLTAMSANLIETGPWL